MNIDLKEKFILSSEESKFLKDLIEENESCLKIIVKNNLGTKFEYLLEDSISELYLLACSKIKTLKSHPYPMKWLAVSAKLIAKANIRKHSKEFPSSSLNEISEQTCCSDIEEDAIYNIWLEYKIPEQLIARLTKREREVYYKIYIENKKTKDIAKELNVSENNIRNIHKNLRDKIYDSVKRKKF